MGTKLARVLDECLVRTSQGESIDTCLSDYANVREQLEPLLHTAMSIASMPKVAPSDNFRKIAKGRLMARLHQETNQTKIVTLDERVPLFDALTMAGQRLWQAMSGAGKIAIPVTLALLLAIAASLGTSNFISPSPALASQCTLSIFSGNVEVQTPKGDSTQRGTDGMTLSVGTHVETALDSHALLTFFDGSTIELEPGTNVEIRQLEYDNEQTINIVLKQWAGRTWSRVVKMADAGSHYKIETPSACAIVRGTLFLTEVDEVGATKVLTTEGLVTVSAQGEEVSLPIGQQTVVEPGTPPSEPTTVDITEYVKSQEKVQKGSTENGLSQSRLLPGYQSSNPDTKNNQNHGNGKANNQAAANSQNQGDSQNNSQDNDNGNGHDQSNDQSQDNGNGNDNSQGNDQCNDQSQDNGNGNGHDQGNDQSQNESKGNAK